MIKIVAIFFSCQANDYKWINLFLMAQEILKNHNYLISNLYEVKIFNSLPSKLSDNFERHKIFEQASLILVRK